MVVGTGDVTIVYELNTNEDDARLIAAAPDLLSALELMVYMIEEMAPELTGRVYEFAKAAITKATGEQE